MSDNYRRPGESAGKSNKKSSSWRSAASSGSRNGQRHSGKTGRKHFWSSEEGNERKERERRNRGYGSAKKRTWSSDRQEKNWSDKKKRDFSERRDNSDYSRSGRDEYRRNKRGSGNGGRGRDNYRSDRYAYGDDNYRSRRDERRERDFGNQRSSYRESSYRDGYRKNEYTADGYRERRNPRQQLLAEIPESITPESLDKKARKHLRSLTPDNADAVARHLAYAGEMLDLDPEVAYRHAKIAFQRAARIDVVREALGLAAYATERYGEALKELRTYRRMSADYSHVAIEADAERGLGRAEKALHFISEIPLAKLNVEAKIELAIVTSGARADLGDTQGGLAVLEKIIVENLPAELAARVQSVKADRLEELGKIEEANELRNRYLPVLTGVDDDTDYLFDLDEVLDDEELVPAELQNDSDSEVEMSENFDQLVESAMDAELAVDAEAIEADAEATMSSESVVDAEMVPEQEAVLFDINDADLED